MASERSPPATGTSGNEEGHTSHLCIYGAPTVYQAPLRDLHMLPNFPPRAV